MIDNSFNLSPNRKMAGLGPAAGEPGPCGQFSYSYYTPPLSATAQQLVNDFGSIAREPNSFSKKPECGTFLLELIPSPQWNFI
jgi:hypothetical protein